MTTIHYSVTKDRSDLMGQEHQKVCQICNKEYNIGDLYPADLLRTSLVQHITLHYPNWSPSGFICSTDLERLRVQHIQQMMEEDRGELSQLDADVLRSIREHEILSENINKEYIRNQSFSEKLADRIALFAGSWGFITFFIMTILLWIVVNGLNFFGYAFDPFPYILLNLTLSCVAALQAPVILMSQNRQAARERLKADYEYGINLKAELQIRQINSKLDQLMRNQWKRLLEIQQVQIDLAEQLLEKNGNHHSNH